MEINFINPILTSCINVLSTMFGLEPQSGKPYVREHMKAVEGHNVTGIIGMQGPKNRASVAVIFPAITLVNITKRLIPFHNGELDQTATELAGELSNMILGGAKNTLVDEGYEFTMQLPTVIIGYDYLIAHQTKSKVIQIPFYTIEGNLFVEASMEGGPAVKPNISIAESKKLLGDVDDDGTVFF